MTEDQKKQVVSKMPGPLPGLGGKPSLGPLPGIGGGGLPGIGGGLPGMGARPGGVAPLPGMKPAGGLPSMSPVGGAAPLPGMKPGPLPGGLGGQPGNIVPPFMQQAQPAPEPTPSIQQDDRDPFGQASAPNAAAMMPMIMPATNEVSIEDAPLMNEKSKKTMIMAVSIVSVFAIAIGYLLGNGVSARRELNIAIRDALIVDYELKEAGKLFDEAQTMINSALIKTGKREFDEQHLNFLKSNIGGNPLKPTLLTERNYKKFDAAAVQWLIDYYKKWDELYGLIQEHRRATEYDIKELKATQEQFIKLLETTYGVVFKRDKEGKFFGNVVVLGEVSGDTVRVQTDSGTYAFERTMYNPEGEDSALTKDPEKYVIMLGQESKAGLLGNATQSHFTKYSKRIKEISDLMKTMGEIQQNLLNKISSICSQDPAAFVDPNPEEGLQEYIARAKNMSAAAQASE